MSTPPLAFPLHWPDGLPRAKSRGASPFRVSMNRALADLKDSLRLFGADTGGTVRNLVISSNVSLGRNRPDDPGIAVYFDWDDAQRCIAVDRFQKPEDNVRAIYYVLEARRQEMRYGGLHIVRAAFRGFAALPPPDPTPTDWRRILGLRGEATLEAVETAYRDRARACHPDRPGGSARDMAALNAARDAARRELAA